MTSVVLNLLNVDYNRWNSGLTLDQFVAGVDTYQDELRQRLREMDLSAEDHAFFMQISDPFYVLVLTECWSVDSLMNLPILAQIVEAIPNAALRIFLRGHEPELDLVYRMHGIGTIPVCTFFDQIFTEIGTWIERPQKAHRLVQHWYSEHPEVTAIRSDLTLNQKERRERLYPIYDELRVEMEQWYTDRLAAATVKEIRELLEMIR